MDENSSATSSSSALLSKKRPPGTLDAFVIKHPKITPASNFPTHSDEPPVINTEQLETDTATDNSSSDPSFEQQSSHVHENDIGNFYNVVSTLSNGQKYDYLCTVWKPPQSYPFPKNSAGRKFQ
eukprot:Seg8161.2 transcript_id=Seg8161.2/GoldUCD/mRNA.D3Y31 product="hypothetical protein" protein_id=Seg8161.2/GoldUCD/D3Y31